MAWAKKYLMLPDTESELFFVTYVEKHFLTERHFHLQQVAREYHKTEQSHNVKDVLMLGIKIILKWMHPS